MGYVTLYRKYRPRTFNEVVGQEVVIKILTNSIVNNKIGHAYIFSGPRGTGKTSVAKIFAKAVNCIDNNKGDLCGKCLACKNDDNSSLDIIEIDAASNNGVNEIREIRNNVKLLPTMVKYKVFIIDEVHMLSDSAFNALLKTLEEPPQHVIFILATTELNKVPATILSRCQKFEFKKIPPKCIENRLNYILKSENKKLNKEVLELISKLGDGALRDSINLLDQTIGLEKEEISCDDIYDMIGEEPESSLLSFFNNIVDCNIEGCLGSINSVYEKGRNFMLYAERMQNLVRDIIIYSNTKGYFDENYSKKLDVYVVLSNEKLLSLCDILFDLCVSLKKPINQKILFETYVFKMIELFKKENNCQLKMNIKNDDEKEIEEVKTSIKKISQQEKLTILNNAIAEADSKQKKDFISKYSEVEEYFPNKEYNSIAILMSGAIPEVVSSRTLVFSFKDRNSVVLFDSKIEDIQKFLKMIYGVKYSIVSLEVSEWTMMKKKIVENIRTGKKYSYINENKNNKKTSEIESIFGDSLLTIK